MTANDVKIPDWVQAFFVSIATVAAGIAFAFSQFASASDVEKVYQEVNNIEVRLIKSDIREIKRELRINGIEEDVKRFLTDQLEEALIELCNRRPNDKECR